MKKKKKKPKLTLKNQPQKEVGKNWPRKVGISLKRDPEINMFSAKNWKNANRSSEIDFLMQKTRKMRP